MKRTFFGMLVSVAMTGTLVAAQNSQVPSSSQSPSRDQSQSMSRSTTPTDITVTGCLVQGEDSDTYLLQNAKVSTSTSSARPGASSSSASGSQSPSAGQSSQPSAGQSSPSASSQSSQSAASRGITYKLDTASGVKDIDFKTNLNHEVRVTGMLEMASNSSAASRPGSSSSASGASSSSQSSQGMADRDSKDLTTFSAKTVTKIADTCPAVS